MNYPPPPPPPQNDNPIITQFKPQGDQWELTDDNINRIDPETGQTILHNYCQYINTTPLEVYRYLIETLGCDVNVQDKCKDTPLMFALGHFSPTEDGGNISVLTYLLTHNGINANLKNQYGSTLLHLACEKINYLPLDIITVLIETHGADVNIKDNNNDTPLHIAVFYFELHYGNITVLTYLLGHKNINANITCRYGGTLLHTACKLIDILPLDLFKVLIDTHGFDVNAQDDDKNTPLHNAIRSFNPNGGSNINVLAYLINQKGVNVNIKDQFDYTILHLICQRINKLPLAVFKLLIENGDCYVNVQDKNSYTPIHHALYCFNPDQGGDITVLAYLVSQGKVDVNIKNQRGDPLLHYVCKKVDKLPLDLFKLLIEIISSDVNIHDIGKDTPLHKALHSFNSKRGGDITVLIYLLSQGKVNPLLHYACKNINSLPLDVFKLLIETLGCDVNAQDNNKDTPLHLAFHYFSPHKYRSDIAVLSYLIRQKGVDVNAKGQKGRNVLHLTCINNLPDSKDSVELNAKFDSILCLIVETIAERCIEQILGGTTS
jgi:ankyrin repeat protein